MLADAIEPRYRVLVLLAVFASLRWGELMGLRKTDLDLVAAWSRRAVSSVIGADTWSSARRLRPASGRSPSRGGWCPESGAALRATTPSCCRTGGCSSVLRA